MKGGPDVSHAAHSSYPTMTDPHKTLPARIPVVNTQETASDTAGNGTTDVSATQVTCSIALDTKPDARTNGTDAAPAPVTNPAASQPLPINRDKELEQ